MKYSPNDMLNESCLYTLTVYSKVNGECHETKHRVISSLCFLPLCNAFQAYMIKKLKKEGVYDYYEFLTVVVTDRKAL